MRLFLEAIDFLAIQDQCAETARRLSRGQRGQLAVRLVERDRFGDIDITDAVAIGEAECLLTFQVALDALQATASHGFVTGIDQRDFPRFRIARMNFHLIILHVERYVRGVQKIVGKVFLDDITFITAADDEIIHTVSGVRFHNMPQNRLTTDFNHRFWFGGSFFTNSRTQTTS